MKSPAQLMPGRSPPAPLQLREVDRTAAPLLRSTYVRIGTAVDWIGRTTWSDTEWEAEVSRPGVRAWIAVVNDEAAGLLELEAEPNGNVGIVIFGLVPEFLGKGFGGAFLTLATQLAWDLEWPGDSPTRRSGSRRRLVIIPMRYRTTKGGDSRYFGRRLPPRVECRLGRKRD